MPRVISGLYRGKNLLLPQDSLVRPTRNKVLQAAFNMLESRVKLANLHVLDLFCGSGQWGIEALSRGAKHVTFVDKNIQYVSKNLKNIGIESKKFTLKKEDVFTLNIQEADIIFADPPYHKNFAEQVLFHTKFGKKGSLWLLESESKTNIQIPDLFEILKEKKHGINTLYLFKQTT